MKQKKRGLLRLVLTAYIAATILTSLGIGASAYLSTDYDLSDIDHELFRTVYVGQMLEYPVDSDDSYDYTYRFPEDVVKLSSDFFYFTKPGKYKVNASCRINQAYGTHVKNFYYNVEERSSIEGNVHITGTPEIYDGRAVPTFTTDKNAPYTVERAYFECDGAGFYSGDVLPGGMAGKEVTLRIEIGPKSGYVFDLLEPSKYWSPIPNVVFLNGEVVNDAKANDSLLQTLNVDIPVTIQPYEVVETEPNGYHRYENETFDLYEYLESTESDVDYNKIQKLRQENRYAYKFYFYKYQNVIVDGKQATEWYDAPRYIENIRFTEPGLYKLVCYNNSGYKVFFTTYIDIYERITIDQDINVTTSNIINGKKFVDPTSDAGKKCYVSSCTATIDGKEYKAGDIVKASGSTATIRLELTPFTGYKFGNADPGSTAGRYSGTVYCDGEDTLAVVETDPTTGAQKLVMEYTTTLGDKAPVKSVEITDFRVPVEGKSLSTTASSSIGIVTDISYTIFRKVIDSVEIGDEVEIGFTVKLPDSKTFAEGATAVWNSQNSALTVKSSSMGDNERRFIFKYTVKPEDGKVIDTASFEIEAPKSGKPLPTKAISLVDGLEDAAIVWTPDDTNAKGSVKYTAKIPLNIISGYGLSDDFVTKGNFRVNGKLAKLVVERENVGATRPVYKDVYYLEYTFEPVTATFDIDLKYSSTLINAKVGDQITITANTNIDPMLAEKLNVQWYKSTSSTYGKGTAISGATSPTLTFKADLIGTRYYYCVFDVVIDGAVGTYKQQMVKVDTTSGGDFSIRVDKSSSSTIITYKDSDDFSLEVTPENADGNVTYKWYACDEDGNVTDKTVLGNGRALLMNGIRNSDAYRTFFYKCVATSGKQSDEVIFSVSLRDKKTDETKIPFTDVKETDKFYDSIKYVYAHEPMLMNGTSGTTFDPSGKLTRAAIVTVLYRLEGSPEVSGATGFTDVPKGEWYSDAVIWAVQKGITNGYGGGIFAPTDPITREQLATFLYRYANLKDYSTKSTTAIGTSDASAVSDWAVDPMKWAYSIGIVEDVSKNVLDPTSAAARHMIATGLMRFCLEYSI